MFLHKYYTCNSVWRTSNNLESSTKICNSIRKDEDVILMSEVIK